MSEYTPMMQQYFEVKKDYEDCILFYRLGDFYEMFFEDAKVASKELELTLTGKNCGMEERAPMCGVPFHAADTYISRLIKKGLKVAICEQVEDPKAAKGIVKREVIRVVTPGTAIETDSLSEGINNYILCIEYQNNQYGMAFCDVSTGQFLVTQLDSTEKVQDELAKFNPSEIVANDAFMISPVYMSELYERYGVPVFALSHEVFDEKNASRLLGEQFDIKNPDEYGFSHIPFGANAAGALISYLRDTQKNDLKNIRSIKTYHNSDYMILDRAAIRNLELIETLRDKEKRGSLLWVLDHTKTAMGARRLRGMVEQPLTKKKEIEKRLDAVGEFGQNMIEREELREYLSPIYDIERLITRITYKTANPRDLLAFKNSLEPLSGILTILSDMKADKLIEISKNIDPLTDIYELLSASIRDEAPIGIHDGDIIKEAFDDEVDRLRSAKTNGKEWLMELAEKEREATGIKNLRIKYNKVFGYYIEVTNSYKDLVPDRYRRKQTLANAERFETDELKEMEQTILGAQDKLNHLEFDLYNDILVRIGNEIDRIQRTASAIAELDVYLSLAYTAEKQRYVRPAINERGIIDIKGGRHPVVEAINTETPFIENDTALSDGDNRVAVITGPNMAGKSTYMRQTALIVLLAQIGSFVPAKSADIGVVDRIFTRVGASDDLAGGQSTFMVEMNEVSNILKNATKDSLLILDEIGRGTSTFDGLSIAWAVLEYISDKDRLGAKTLFATHYHELTDLEDKLPGVENYNIAVKENGDDIVFLRKIVRGGADKSYGIQVAKIAGIPDEVIDRAREIAARLENNEGELSSKVQKIAKEKKKDSETIDGQLTMALIDPGESDVIKRLKAINIATLTPLDALNILDDLKKRVE